MATTVSGKSEGKGKMSQELIISGFQELRNQQRAIASKISEIEMDRKEHEYVAFCHYFAIHISTRVET